MITQGLRVLLQTTITQGLRILFTNNNHTRDQGSFTKQLSHKGQVFFYKTTITQGLRVPQTRDSYQFTNSSQVLVVNI